MEWGAFPSKFNPFPAQDLLLLACLDVVPLTKAGPPPRIVRYGVPASAGKAIVVGGDWNVPKPLENHLAEPAEPGLHNLSLVKGSRWGEGNQKPAN